MLFSPEFFSQICTEKGATNESNQSKWSNGYSQKRKDNHSDNESDITASYSPLGSAKFFGASWRNDIIENGKKYDDKRSYDKKGPRDWTSWSQLEKDKSDIGK